MGLKGEYDPVKNHPGVFRYKGKRGESYGIDYRDGEGRKIRRILKGALLKDADAELKRMHELVEKGDYKAYVKAKERTLNELLDEYIKKVEDQTNFKRTIRYWLPLWRERLGTKLLCQIDYKMLEDFRDERRKTPTKYGKPRTDRTVDIEMEALQRMFKRAFKWGWIERNPFERGDDFLFRKTGKRNRALTPEEVQRVIDASSKELKPIILIAVLTGLRKGDIFRLRWSEINLEKGRIILVEQKTGKTRIINLSNDAMMVIRNLPVKGEYVFPGRTGNPLTDVKRSFAKAIRNSGIDPGKGSGKVVFHTLRHSCVSQLLERGADTLAVRNFVNHASTQMTEHYAHLSEEYQRKTGGLLDGVYNLQAVIGKNLVRSEENKEKVDSVSA